jgi:hypothetical protein
MADNTKNTFNTAAQKGRRGLRARLGVGLLSLGLASGAGVMAMGAQPASAATVEISPTVVVDVAVVVLPAPHHFRMASMGVSWS